MKVETQEKLRNRNDTTEQTKLLFRETLNYLVCLTKENTNN